MRMVSVFCGLGRPAKKINFGVFVVSLFFGFMLAGSAGFSQTPAPASPPPSSSPSLPVENNKPELPPQAQAYLAALGVARPTSPPLAWRGQATFTYNDPNVIFVPQPQADKWLQSLGNPPSGANFIGILTSTKEEDDWIVTVSFIQEGYVKDEDAQKWDAAQLLEHLRAGTEEGNKVRIQRGFSAVHVKGWVEPPVYDSAMRRLVWSVALDRDNHRPDQPNVINYNTYQLGREGYFSLNMLTNHIDIERDKNTAKKLLAGLSFDVGKRYEDFNPSSDQVAAYGLSALVGGVALKKLGFFALIFASLAKMGKLLVFAVVAVGVAIKSIFSLVKKKPQSNATEHENDQGQG